MTEAFNALNIQVDGSFETLNAIEVWRDDLNQKVVDVLTEQERFATAHTFEGRLTKNTDECRQLRGLLELQINETKAELATKITQKEAY